MPPRRAVRSGVIVLLGLCLLTGPRLASAASDSEDPRTSVTFLQGLRDLGYFDLAAEYLEGLGQQEDVPPELKATIDYELGRLLLDEASRTGDIVRRRALLDQSRAKLDQFTKANPTHPKTPEALVELARLLVEKGHLALLQADEAEPAEREAKLAEARGSFDEATAAYSVAETKLTEGLAQFPAFIPDNDPRKNEKERVHGFLMQAQLQKAVVDYERGQTYPEKSKERIESLATGIGRFEDLYKRYRTQMAGLTARMWQGKCYEEQGELGKAMGIYNELVEHSDPRLRPLQRYVGYFRIIVLGKREEFALAADEATRWLRAVGPAGLKEKDGLGVQLELVKNIIAQFPKIENENDKAAALKRVTDTLANIVRYASPFKVEALELLKKYKPSAAANAADVARMGYDEAVTQGEQAIASQEWDRSALLFRHAIQRAETARDLDKTNYARYNLAYSYYMAKRYYEAEVLAEHLARRYPQGGLSPKASELAMAAFAEAYNTYTSIDRAADLNNLIEIATYAAEAFARQEQGDTARMTLGQIYHGTGRYDQAIKVYESVDQKSPRWAEAATKAGASYWEKCLQSRRQGKTAEAESAQTSAISTLEAALKSRRDSGATPTDPGLLGNACDLADIYLETGQADEALKLMDPLDKQQQSSEGATLARLKATMLRTHIAKNQTDLALADMSALEKAGGKDANLTQLYYRLGKLLETEMESLKKKGDSAGLTRTRAAYLKFLEALVASTGGQTLDSLLWAGENMLKLGKPLEAEQVFRKILKDHAEDAKFLATPGSTDKVLQTRLKLSASLRGQKKFSEAESLVGRLIAENPRIIDPLMEKGYLAEDIAATRQGDWASAFAQWKTLAMRLGTARSKPVEYYEAWFHAAVALKNDDKPTEAKQTLASVMRLSSSVGGPEMKQKYESMLKQLK